MMKILLWLVYAIVGLVLGVVATGYAIITVLAATIDWIVENLKNHK